MKKAKIIHPTCDHLLANNFGIGIGHQSGSILLGKARGVHRHFQFFQVFAEKWARFLIRRNLSQLYWHSEGSENKEQR